MKKNEIELTLPKDVLKFISGVMACHAKRNYEAAELDYTPDTRKSLRLMAKKQADKANNLCMIFHRLANN